MEQDIIDEYLSGREIDPCKHSQFEMDRLAEYFGDDARILVRHQNALYEPVNGLRGHFC